MGRCFFGLALNFQFAMFHFGILCQILDRFLMGNEFETNVKQSDVQIVRQQNCALDIIVPSDFEW